MARVFRVFWAQQVSRWLNFNIAGVITEKSVVQIVACEGHFVSGQFESLNATGRMRGDATMYVKNIHPHDGGVEFFLQIDWPHPLDVTLDIIVMDPPEQGFIA